MLRSTAVLFACWCVCLFGLPAFSRAQSISLTGPTGDQEFAEGDDFAFNELRNAWDMNQLSDMPWQEGVGTAEITANGTFYAVNRATGGYFFILFPGFKGTLRAEAPQGDKGSPRYGRDHMIDGDKYNYLCIRSSTTNPSQIAFSWEHDLSLTTYWPDGTKLLVLKDNFPAGWGIHCADLGNPNQPDYYGAWRGKKIFAFSYGPSLTAPSGATNEVDWARIADPNSAPIVHLSWSVQGVSQSQARFLKVDSDNSGYNGIPIAYFQGGSDPHAYDVVTAALPHGDYYFYVEAGNVRSNYSKRIRIRGRTDLVFQSPTEFSGRDYFTHIGTPIRGVSADEITNLASNIPQVLRQFVNGFFGTDSDADDGHVFSAWTELASAYPPQLHSDNELVFRTSHTYPIVPGRECQATYKVAVNYRDTFPIVRDSVEFGNVWRIVVSKKNLFDPESGDLGAQIVYPGLQRYTVDLCALNEVNSGILYRNISSAELFRMDPSETSDVSVQFKLDTLLLTTANYSPNGTYEVKFTLEGGVGPFQVDFYRDSDQSGGDGVYLGSMNDLQQGSFTYQWNTSGLANGSTWYIYAVVSDPKGRYVVYAARPVTAGAMPDAAPLARNAVQDIDGDGRSDPFVLRRGTAGGRTCTRDRRRRLVCRNTPARGGMMFGLGSSVGLRTFPIPPGNFFPSVFDMDGDAASDFGMYAVFGNLINWTFVLSQTNTLYQRTFGLNGDVPALADWNGNGKNEITVFRSGQWWILDEANAVTFVVWGGPGDIPNPADFDGDGRADLTVYRGGQWLVFRSSNGQLLTGSFGLDGDVPVAADYDGDGRADFAVYRPSLGAWFIHPSSGAPDIMRFFGLWTDQAKRGLDFTGDGKPELVVYRPSTSQWYWYNLANGAIGIVPFGLPSDLTPVP